MTRLTAPDRYGRIRTSRADREQVIDTLKAAFVQDRLTKDELDADDPGARPADLRRTGFAHGRSPGRTAPVAPQRQSSLAKAGVYVTVVAGLFVIAAISNGSWNPLTMLGTVLFFSPVWLLALTGLLTLHSRPDRHAVGRFPPEARALHVEAEKTPLRSDTSFESAWLNRPWDLER